MQNGDSGGPLVARYSISGDEIIGVAVQVGLLDCARPTAADIWHPVYPVLGWIKKILQDNRVDIDKYQPQLANLH